MTAADRRRQERVQQAHTLTQAGRAQRDSAQHLGCHPKTVNRDLHRDLLWRHIEQSGAVSSTIFRVTFFSDGTRAAVMRHSFCGRIGHAALQGLYDCARLCGIAQNCRWGTCTVTTSRRHNALKHCYQETLDRSLTGVAGQSPPRKARGRQPATLESTGAVKSNLEDGHGTCAIFRAHGQRTST